MPLCENQPFQSHLYPQNQRVTDCSAFNPCYCWLSNGRCPNQKNLDHEIETFTTFAFSMMSSSGPNQKNLDHEIETRMTTSGVVPAFNVQTKRISITRLKLLLIRGSRVRVRPNQKNLDCEIETTAFFKGIVSVLCVQTKRISIARLKLPVLDVSLCGRWLSKPKESRLRD